MAISESPRSNSIAPRLTPRTIAVLAGGESSERTVSLASGANVARALTLRGHKVVTVDPAEVDPAHYDWGGIDVAFLALHGRLGEDGQIQSLLEVLGVPYTGSDPAASRLGFSKSASKERFFQHCVPTPPYVLIHVSDPEEHILAQARTLGFPLVVKPDTHGSSLGVSIVRNEDDLALAVKQCFSLDAFGILEKAVIGSEWTAGLLDDTVLPVIQIKTQRPFFDYYAKYEDDQTDYCFDFDVPLEVVQRIEQVSQSAYRAIGAKGLARVDVMLDESHLPWVLEVNTIPGLTDHSLVPKAAARLGLEFGELCERAIESCLKTAAGERR